MATEREVRGVRRRRRCRAVTVRCGNREGIAVDPWRNVPRRAEPRLGADPVRRSWIAQNDDEARLVVTGWGYRDRGLGNVVEGLRSIHDSVVNEALAPESWRLASDPTAVFSPHGELRNCLTKDVVVMAPSEANRLKRRGLPLTTRNAGGPCEQDMAKGNPTPLEL